MSETTEISWAHSTFNLRWGCTKVSPACDFCYAETTAARWGHNVWGADATRKPMSEHYWNEPLRWEKKAAASGEPWRVFCSSMADVFEDAPGELGAQMATERARLWELVEQTRHLTWMLLTKRPQNVMRMVPRAWHSIKGAPGRPNIICWPHNVWVGTTVENQRYANLRIPQLLAIPAPVRFLSCEPMLGAVDLSRYISRLSWVICGGESGPRARPMHPDWARSLRDQCDQAVPYLFKQWGEWLPYEPDAQPPFWAGQNGDLIDGHHLPVDLSEGDPTHGWWAPNVDSDGDIIYRRVGKTAAGHHLDGRTWDEYPT